MRLTLTKVRIQNFKGIKDLSLVFDPTQPTVLKGRNGCGKSSIVDAFAWCLFNRDSHGNAPGSDNFREKPLDESGREIHGLDTEVELFMDLDGKMFNLRRVQKENWTKKRGSADAVFSGNNSTYWINDVETKQSDYKDRISQIADDDLFRILGTLSEFNRLDWKKRRAMLIGLSDKDIDGDLMARPEYASIKEETERRAVTADELRKIMQDRKRAINDELKALPIRIDEQVKVLGTLDDESIADSRYIVKECEQDISKIDDQIAEAMSMDQATADRARMETLTKEIFSLKKIISQEHDSKVWQVKTRIDDLQAQKKRMQDEQVRAEGKLKDLQATGKAESEKCDKLRDAYKAKYAEKYVDTIEDICPTCKRPLEPEDVEAARNEAVKAFNERKKAELDDIKARGQLVAKRVKDIESERQTVSNQVTEISGKLEGIEKELASALDEKAALPDMPDYTSDPKIMELEDELNALRAKGVKADPAEHVMKLRERKAQLAETMRRHQEIIAKAATIEASKDRIEELREQQKAAGQRMIDTEKMIDLLDRFTQDRCAALEESINAKFRSVRWKLFDVQINGGIADCCMCMIPCESGLVAYNTANTASQINADIEIINALSDHYEVKVPLFVDNAERVLKLAKTDTQMIVLAVSQDESITPYALVTAA